MRTPIFVHGFTSDWIDSVGHNYRGVLTVTTKEGRTYKFRAPVEVARQAQRIHAAQQAGSRKSVGKWVNTAVFGMYPRLQ